MKLYRLIVLTLCFAVLSGCSVPRKTDDESQISETVEEESGNEEAAVLCVKEESDRNLIRFDYPQLDKDTANAEEINRIIREFALDAVKEICDDFQGEADAKPEEFDWDDPHSEWGIEVECEITRNDSEYLSVVFQGLAHNMHAAHPIHYFDTVIVDIESLSIVGLEQLYDIDESFIGLCKEECMKQIMRYVDDKEYIQGFIELAGGNFESAELFGSRSCFLTENELGISVSLIYALGDHFEFTVDLDRLEKWKKENCSEETDKSVQEAFINETAFEYIKEIYSEIDFTSEFKETGGVSDEFYREKYAELLNCESSFTDKRSGEQKKIDELLKSVSGYTGDYDPSAFSYYYFDMDSDGRPELCITDESRFVYIMKYDGTADKTVLWYEIFANHKSLMGSGKLSFYSGTSDIMYAFEKLTASGDEDLTVWFYIVPYDLYTEYWVSLPEYADKSRLQEIPKNVTEQSETLKDRAMYRVTKEQFDELTDSFFSERDRARTNIENVKFSYEELFGSDSKKSTESSAEIIKENEFYRILKLNNGYYYELIDSNGKIVRADGPYSREPSISFTDVGLLRLEVSAGPQNSTKWSIFCDTENGRSSDVYYGILDVQGETAAYTDNRKIVVRNIFDSSKYCMEIDEFDSPLSDKTVEPFKSAKFSDDGQSLTVTYFSGEDFYEISEDIKLK